MCGIIGGIDVLEGNNINESLNAIQHRGPDSQNVWHSCDKKISFGHVRLSIIDLDARANQPMICPRTGNVIVFNGEIYNYQTIKQELIKSGWSFTTSSDTEVLLAAYGQWGIGCLKLLNGMFAFVVYDPRKNSLLLARDRVGKKPLYYSLWNGDLIFASEIKALLKIRPELPTTLDYYSLKEYMDLGYIPGDLTIYKQIKKLKPAQYGIYNINSKSFSTHCYWSLPPSDAIIIKEEEAAEELEYLIRDAVRLRLVGDVPIGLFLSGGVDSGLIAAIAAQENPNLSAYTAKFSLAKYDESGLAKHVANWIGIKHHNLPIESTDDVLLNKLAYQFDEPFADSSLLPTYLISQASRKHVTVALSGDGGDELFAGYPYYSFIAKEERWNYIPSSLRILLSRFHNILPLNTYGKNFLRRLSCAGANRFLFATSMQEHISISPLKYEVENKISNMMSDRYRKSILLELETASHLSSPMTLLQKMTRLDFHSYLPDDILVKMDRASMLASLEVRAPLLDYRIVEFAFSLPDSLRLNRNIKKYILKRIARKYLPKDFPFEKKQGFSIPETEWFKGSWSGLIENMKIHSSSLLDASKVMSLHKRHGSHGRYGKLLFKIFMLSQFEQLYKISFND